MEKSIQDSMVDIFYKVQFNETDHPKYIKRLTTLYNKNNLKVFWKNFVRYLQLPLSIEHNHQKVLNTLQFCAKFCVSFYPSSESETTEPISPFLEKLFKFLLSSSNAKDKRVRFRICYFLNLLLNSMGDNAFIDDSLCDQITNSMMDRLLDKSPKVRAQAVFALFRLQDPSDDACPIIKLYIFHVMKDPNVEVRKAVLSTMGKNQKTLQAALSRTRDIDHSVRKKAYEFISKITVRSLTIEQRERLLKDGFNDRSENVRKCVSEVLLPSWLRYFKGEYLNLIHALDAGIGTETATSALQILFKNTDLKILLNHIPLDKNSKLIPLTNLTNENALYWKCVIQHLHHLSCTEELEMVIPELSVFSKYISNFMSLMSSQSYETWENECHKFILLQLFEISTMYDLSDEVGRKNLNDVIIEALISDHCSLKIIECIVHHLEKVIPNINDRLNTVAKIISDIRLPLKETIVQKQFQVTSKQLHEKKMQITRLKVEILELEEELYILVKEQKFLEADCLKEKINILKEEVNSLSNILEPNMAIRDDIQEDNQENNIQEDNIQEKNDASTMVKCLNILYATLQSIHTLTPILRNFMCLVLDSLKHSHYTVRIIALKTLSVYCILDKELAKMYIMMLFYQFSLEQEDPEIWAVSLKGIFDLLLTFGLEYFDILHSQNNSTRNKSERTRILYTHEDSNHISLTSHSEIEEGSCNFIKIITGLLTNENQNLRTTAVEGLCKLLFSQRINSSNLISLLIIMCYNPVNDNDFYLRQCLCTFFENYVIKIPDAHQVFEAAYFPTLRVICEAPDVSPLKDINAYHVSKFILNSIRRGYQKIKGQDLSDVHNDLAFHIVAEILNPESKIDQEILIRTLPNLCIQIEDSCLKENLINAINDVIKMVSPDKLMLKYIEQFKQRLEIPSDGTEVQMENCSKNDE